MYIPNHNLQTDSKIILDFIRKYSFGIFVTVKGNLPFASHLPFVIENKGDSIILYSHLAKANSQLRDFSGKAMVIFREPHAYISTKHYEHKEDVPTWNYVAVHIYGTVEIITDKKEGLKLLEKTIETYEKEYEPQWQLLSHKYKDGMYNGIVPFKIVGEEIHAKEKLSQNRSMKEIESIVRQLENSDNSTEKAIGGMMQKKYGN